MMMMLCRVSVWIEGVPSSNVSVVSWSKKRLPLFLFSLFFGKRSLFLLLFFLLLCFHCRSCWIRSDNRLFPACVRERTSRRRCISSEWCARALFFCVCFCVCVCSFIVLTEGERKRVDFVTRIFRRKKIRHFAPRLLTKKKPKSSLAFKRLWEKDKEEEEEKFVLSWY